MTLLKKTAWGFVIVLGVANIGALIGHSVRGPVKPAQTTQIEYPPSSEYTSYTVTVNPDGSYSIDYRAHDPTVLDTETYTDTSNGVFGIGGRSTVSSTKQYVPGTGSGEGNEEGKSIAEQIECIKAEGGGESNGALVGGSVATSLTPFVSGIPYVGWLATGWLVMFGQDLGSNIGGEIASSVKGC
tara:strand:- start:3609 stop:4163 length:555 start_codon:yes stop_codon:yes gene_type:complete